MILLTGDRHSGKTGFVLEHAEQTRCHGLRVAGIACPGLWKNNMRNGFELLELDTGRRHLLSMRVPGLRPIPYMFDALSMEKGKNALSASRGRKADLIIVDEVGPLELEGEGWAPCLHSLLHLCAPLQIWVVRRRLAKRVKAHFGISAEVADINQQNCMSGVLEKILQKT
ncbi:MAG: nucleoside-triphosphatase [Desulfobacterales bacterium]